MIGDVEVSSLKGAMDVRIHLSRTFDFRLIIEVLLQLWLQNQAGMENTLSSTVARVTSAATSLYNNLLGQTRSQARLNAIASYDQSNELFKVSDSGNLLNSFVNEHSLGFPEQGDDVLLCTLERG